MSILVILVASIFEISSG